MTIPAIVAPNDRCPADCVGYETFREMQNNFSLGRDLVNFIPKTGRSCSADQVGCEEFTNLDVVAKGGEGREYYSYLRECLKLPESADQCSYYYTWAGSETSGYQLRRYYLKKDSRSNGPALVPNPRKDLGECDSPDDIIINPHCKQFYDSAGNIYYRIYENTITCSEQCLPYRKTVPAVYKYQDYNGDESVNDNDCLFINAEPAQESTCQQILSDPNWTGKCCTRTNFMAIPTEGTACASVNAGCREYKGNAAYNLRQVFLDDFETGTVGPWVTETPNASLSPSTESIYFGGRSMKAKIGSSGPTEISLLRDISGQVSQGKSYLLSFLIKGIGAGEIKFGITGNPVQKISTNEINDWQLVTVGPLYLANLPTGTVKLNITAKANKYEPPPVPNGGYYTFFIDNILLKEVQESIYLIKDSWQTPSACDKPTQGAMLYCQEYRDRSGRVHYLKSFTRLCREDIVGCEALIDTKNSSNPFRETFNITDPDNPIDNLIISQDEMVYFVNDRQKSCQTQDKGCQKFGLPVLDANGSVVGWSDQFLRNNPDQYKRKPILCLANGLNCEEFMPAGKTTPVYFKDPGEKVCEWRENVPIGGENKSGWFKKGTNQPCYTDEKGNPYYQPGTLIYGIKKPTETGYQGWVGQCQEGFAGCNEYYDPVGKTSYYYLDNDKLDKTSCRGQVSLKEGCVLFKDQSNLVAIYNSTATYAKSEANQNHLVSPVDCTKKPWLEGQGSCDPGGGYEGTDYCRYCYAKSQNSNDANLILKVRRDRVCGEWLYCSGSHTVWDQSLGENREVCDSLTRCNKMVGQGSRAECVSFPSVSGRLTEEVYKSRDVSWAGMDYSGYSLFDFYPVEKLQPRNYGTSANPNYQLTYFDGSNDYGPGGKRCFYDKDCPGGGNCVGVGNDKFCTIPKTCQAYPENSSPFVAKEKVSQYYPQVNFCEDKDGEECQCFYKKAEYGVGGSVKKYFNPKTDLLGEKKTGICVNKDAGKFCDPDEKDQCDSKPCPIGACGCERLTQETTYYGQRNFCLEPDPTKPKEINACLTWWPGGAGIGDPDIYNQFREAGYFADSNRQWYCVGSLDSFVKRVCNDANNPPECVSPEYTCESELATPWLKDDVVEKFLEGGDCSNCPFKKIEGCPISSARDVSYSSLDQVYKCSDIQGRKCTGGCFHVDGNGGGQKCECTVVLKYGFDSESPTMPDIPKDVVDRITLDFKSDDITSVERCNFSKNSDWNLSVITYVSACEKNNWGEDVDEPCSDGRVSKWSNTNNNGQDWLQIKVEWDSSNNLKNAKLVLKFADGSSDDGGFESGGFRIYFKSPCQNLFKVADSTGLTTTWTNRLKLKSQMPPTPYENPEPNEKAYNYVCQPRGSTGRDSCPNQFDSMIINSENKENFCEYYTGGIYNSEDDLAKLFVKTYPPIEGKDSGKMVFSYNRGEETGNHPMAWRDESGGIDKRQNARDKAWEFAPKVSPVCFTSAGTPMVCRGQDGIPISGLTIGNNYNQDIVRTGAYTAVLKFYGWADRNQMPIRELIVDWGDGAKIGENVSMLAKNHKEACTKKCYKNDGTTNEQSCTSDYPTNSSICSAGKICCPENYPSCLETFGDSSDACLEQYWQFTHTYICSGQGSLPSCGQNKSYNCWDGSACVFKPKVYLKDNWGWCAGANSSSDGWAGDGSCQNKIGVLYQGLIKIKPVGGGQAGQLPGQAE
jgi:hypothetical protein